MSNNLMMKYILRLLLIVQERECKDPLNYTHNKRRLNPLNPLSYLLIIAAFVVGIIAYGVVGFWGESDLKNPFKWR